MKNEKIKYLSIRVPEMEIETANKLIQKGHYINVSDFVRTAIRNELIRKEKHI